MLFMQIGSKEVSSHIDNNVSTLSTEDADACVRPNQRQLLFMNIFDKVSLINDYYIQLRIHNRR